MDVLDEIESKAWEGDGQILFKCNHRALSSDQVRKLGEIYDKLKDMEKEDICKYIGCDGFDYCWTLLP